MDLSAAKPQGCLPRWSTLDCRHRIGYRVARHAIRFQAAQGTPTGGVGRGRLRRSDRRDGNSCAVSMDTLERLDALLLLDNPPAAAANSLIPHSFCDLLVCIPPSLSRDVRRLFDVPELRQ